MKDKTINDFLKVVVSDFAELGGYWPVKASQIKGYFHDIFYQKIYQKYQQDSKKFQKAISSLPITVLRVFLLRDSILALKIAKKYHRFPIKNKEIINFFQAIVEVLEEKTHNDSFSLKKELLLLAQPELKRIMEGNWIEFMDEDKRRIISNLSVTLQSYLWSVQYDVYAYGVYWHGPYLVDKNKFLLVKEFFDLNLPMWPQIKYLRARIYYLFSKKGDIKIDVLGNLTYKKNIWANLLKSQVVLDGKEINSIEKIETLDEYFSKERKRQVGLVEQLEPLEIIKKGIEIYHYMFRDFFESYNESGKPDRAIEERIKELGLYYWERFKGSGEGMGTHQLRQFLQKLYNPRNNFTG